VGREQVRRRRARKGHITRAVLFGPAVLLGPVGWTALGQVAGLAGLAGLAVLSLSVVPVLLLAALSAPGALASAAVPRRWRVEYRHAHGREGARSAFIPARLRRVVMAADRGRCVVGVDCRGGPEIDHGWPWAGGGRTALGNCFVLCHWHNRVKSNYWRDRDGYVHYRPFSDADDVAMAAAILACERRARWNLARWWRAAAAM
jgi:hypothetical protein